MGGDGRCFLIGILVNRNLIRISPDVFFFREGVRKVDGYASFLV